MEIVLIVAVVAFIGLVGFYCMKESDETRRQKEYAAARIVRMQADRERQAAAAYERQRAPRSSPVYTGSQTRSSGSTPTKAEVKRHDNSFENVVDSYQAPTYHSSHSTSSYSSSSCSSSSSSDSSSSSSDSGSSGGCD